MSSKTDSKALTPDTFADQNYRQPFVDFSKHIPWLKGFTMYQPPTDHTIEVRKESQTK
jgi:hypothetical protein